LKNIDLPDKHVSLNQVATPSALQNIINMEKYKLVPFTSTSCIPLHPKNVSPDEAVKGRHALWLIK